MTIFKKNFWFLFYSIFFTSTLLLSVLLYKLSNDVILEEISKQENITKITANSINSIFLQYESLLDMLGHELIKNKNYNSFEQSREALDNILKLNSNIVAFGLVNPNGQLYVTSSNLKNLNELPNLKDKNETKDSFSHTLNKNVMVIGRTYFHDTLKTLIIPIRKAIRDEKGKVLAVVSAGIHVNKTFETIDGPEHKKIIYRAFDRYNQLTNIREEHDVYNMPYAKEYVKSYASKLIAKYEMSMDEIAKKELVVTLLTEDYYSKEPVLSSSVNLKRYELWVSSQMDYLIIEEHIYKRSGILVLTYLIVMLFLYLLFRNINNSEEKKKKALFYQATHDSVTNLKNRNYLIHEFEKKQLEKPFTLMFIDMDNFKNINDHYSHTYGDRVLKSIANRLNDLTNNGDVLIRYSGDEFLIISYETEKEKIKDFVQKVLKVLNNPFLIEEKQFILTASIGLASYPKDANNFNDIKRYSDIAMYEAKKNRNTYCFFEDSIKERFLRSSSIEQELKRAISNNEIYMVYQPQVNKDGELFGVEALIRWENKLLGFISPEEFIKVAESTGQMVTLGNYISFTSLKEIKEIQELVDKKFNLALNISVKQFMDPEFSKKLFDNIKKTNFDIDNLSLEVTENVFIEDFNYILNLLNHLREEGLRISLDDFGTGYSSLSLLKKLPIDELKIDKTFVDDILEDSASKNMVNSIISIGKKLNMTVLAEGMETKEHKDILVDYGCELFQGYYYSKPLKKEQLLEYIKKKK